MGAFRLHARYESHAGGVVYVASDGAGHPVHVAMLRPGAVGDAAARQRFRAAVGEHLGAGGPVLAASTGGLATAWVAVAADADVAAVCFLAAAAGGVGAPAAGPDYAPHWLQAGASPDRWWWTSRSPRGSQTLTHRLGAGLVLGIAAVMLLLVVVLVPLYLALSALRADTVEAVPAPSPEQQSPSPSPENDSDDDDEEDEDEESGQDVQESPAVPEVPLQDEDITEMPTPAQSPEDLT